MGKPYSSDLRERIYREIAQGQSCRAAGRRFGVSASSAIRVAQRMAESGTLAPERQGRPKGGGKLAEHGALLLGWVDKQPDISLLELTIKLKAQTQVEVHQSSIWRFLKAAGLSYKKNGSGHRMWA